MVFDISKLYPVIKLAGLALLGLGITLSGIYYFLVVKRRRKWFIEVHEMKADGKLHTVARDVLLEKRLKWGTKTIFWLKKRKQECVPPPSEVVDRYNGTEEVDYIRIERDLIPSAKQAKFNYNDPEIKKKLIDVNDTILGKIKSIKTTLFNADAVHERWVYIPIHKTLSAKIDYRPVPYDMNMMVANEISNADEHFASKYEFWKKYGAVITFAATIVFLIIIAVLTYKHLNETTAQMMGEVSKTTGILEKVVNGMAGTNKPPV
jgi:hypothetical protein